MTPEEYTERLLRIESRGWKRLLPVQAPYRWNLRRLRPGRTLEIGCGIGRNLNHLLGQGVGVDTNPHSVEVCRKRGFEAYTSEEFLASKRASSGEFDSILLSHVAEHMKQDQVVECIGQYLPALKPGGRVILITPQEKGFRSDPTHIQFMDFQALRVILERMNFEIEHENSFPFPRWFGEWFIYNEFVVVGKKKP